MIYLCRNKRNGLVKIGFTTNPRHREKTLQSEEPDVFFERIYAGDLHHEQSLHRRFSDKRHRGEWFELDEDDIKLIDALFGDDASRLRREILDEMAIAISRLSADDLSPVLDQIRCVGANEKPLCVGYAIDMKALDILNDLRHDWINQKNPISDEDALRLIRSIL